MQHFYVFLLILATGCCSIKSVKIDQTISIYPDSWFEETGYSSRIKTEKQEKSISGTWSREDALKWLHLMGLSEAEARNECADPFVSQRLQHVVFKTIRSAKEVATYYEKQFRDNGWIEKRKILFLEETNGGGDWLRVYSKNGKEVLLHVIGPWENDTKVVASGAIVERTIIFQFLNYAPEEVFGYGAVEKFRGETAESRKNGKDVEMYRDMGQKESRKK